MVRFDFVIHWIWTIVFAALVLSGLTMVGAKYGWIMGYDIATADYVHRVMSVAYIILTAISIVYEIIRALKHENNKLHWFMIGKSGYQLFTYITTLIFIISGVIIWIQMDSNQAASAFALFVHEKLTYIAVASVIWHIYMKCHAFALKKKTTPVNQVNAGKARLKQDADKGL